MTARGDTVDWIYADTEIIGNSRFSVAACRNTETMKNIRCSSANGTKQTVILTEGPAIPRIARINVPTPRMLDLFDCWLSDSDVHQPTARKHVHANSNTVRKK